MAAICLGHNELKPIQSQEYILYIYPIIIHIQFQWNIIVRLNPTQHNDVSIRLDSISLSRIWL